MENSIRYITDIGQFVESALAALEENSSSEVLISGTFDNSIYKDVLDSIISKNKTNSCRLIIPYVSRNGIISRTYINKIISGGGQVRLNSRFSNNLIIIGKQAFIISLSHKYNKEYGIKTYFECCMITTETNTVDKIYENFMNNWHRSLPLINEG
jgi:hypothetical protein